MTPESVGPLSRPIAIDHLPPEGIETTVEATAEERAALAADFKLPAIHSLEGRFRLTGSSERVHVAGKVRASIAQTCVVSLDPFDSVVEEEVVVEFSIRSASSGSQDPDERLDEITDGRIDLGSLTAEFLVLGLDPYPRKPGADFRFDAGPDGTDSPFAALGKLKSPE